MASVHQHETNPEFRVQGASLGLTDYSIPTEALGFHLNSEVEPLCERLSLVPAPAGTGFQLSLPFPKLLGGRMLCRECGITNLGKAAGFYCIPFNLERSSRNLGKGQKWPFPLPLTTKIQLYSHNSPNFRAIHAQGGGVSCDCPHPGLLQADCSP